MNHPQPTNESELMLYRVLQRGNLLQYYDTFISQGGDDVQQLCEAGEEEFLEIMALVGMASKPLHVRRLQKALQEWVTTPSVYQQSIGYTATTNQIATGSILANVQKAMGLSSGLMAPTSASNIVNAATWTPTPIKQEVVTPANHGSSRVSLSPLPKQSASAVSLNGSYSGRPVSPSNSDLSTGREFNSSSPTPMKDSAGNAMLTEVQIQGIAAAAEELCKTLPEYESKPLNMKKQINQEIIEVMSLPLETPNRVVLMRKYGAIYGRFDSKRKNEKPMSLHEVSVNEAASQICLHRPSLLTRRVDLFPLARQVVQDSGYQYSKGHSRSNISEGGNNSKSQSMLETPPAKRQKTDVYDMAKFTKDKTRHREITQEVTAITVDMAELAARIEESKQNDDFDTVHILQSDHEKLLARQLELITEQSEIIKRQKEYSKNKKADISATNSCDGMEDEDGEGLPPDLEGLDPLALSQPDSTDGMIGEPMVSFNRPALPNKVSCSAKKWSDEYYQQLLDKMLLDYNIPSNVCKLVRTGDTLEVSCFVCDQRLIVGAGHKHMHNLKRHIERKYHLNNLERHISSVSSGGGPVIHGIEGSDGKNEILIERDLCDTTTMDSDSDLEDEMQLQEAAVKAQDKVDDMFQKINKKFKNVFQLWREPEWSMSTFECTICQTTFKLFPPGGSSFEHALKHVNNKSHKGKAKQERQLQKQHSKSGFN